MFYKYLDETQLRRYCNLAQIDNKNKTQQFEHINWRFDALHTVYVILLLCINTRWKTTFKLA